MTHKFEAQQFLRDNFHDASGVVAYLRGKGVADAPSPAAVEKWFQRGSIPGEWLAVLTGFLEGDRNDAGQIRKYVESH